MDITLSDLGRKLDLPVDPALASRPVLAVLRFYPGAPFSEDILYIGTPEEAKSSPCPPLFLSSAPGFGGMWVREPSDPETVLQRCRAAFRELWQMESACRTLDEALLSGQGCGSIISAGASR